MTALSKRTATSITPAEADRAAARHHDDGPFDHHRTGSNNHGAAIGTASAIGTAMETGAAAAGGIGGAKARDRAGNQNCCEKVFHVFSLQWAKRRHLILIYMRFDTLNICDTSNDASLGAAT